MEHVEPSSSRDRIRRDRPVESEEEESKQLRLSDPTGPKRKEFEAMTGNRSRAKAKAADPAGSKRKPSKVAEGTRSPVKAKMAEPTGEKRKADSDAEEEEAQGTPMRSRVEEDADMINRLSRVATFGVLQLHAGSNLTRDSEQHGIDTMDFGGLDMDKLENRERITAWARKRKPAFIIGSPQCKTKEHIPWCCSLYKLQAEEGRMFIHEQTMGASAWKLQCLQEVKELCSSDVDPITAIPLLTVSSDEGTREAEKKWFQGFP